MALGGNVTDLYTRMYSDIIETELQQRGSILEPTVAKEPVEMGERRHIRRLGSIDSVEELTARFDPLDLDETTEEDRYVTPITLHKAVGMSHLDMIRSSSDPRSQVVNNIVMGMGRARDRIILNALGGTTLRNVAGSASNVTFDTTNQQIAVNANVYTSLTGDTMLDEGKVQKACEILQHNHVDPNRDQVYCIASAKQLAFLRYRLSALGHSRGDFLDKKALTIPGVDAAASGYCGVIFIKYEELADSAQLTSGDEYAYFYVSDAVRLCRWEALTTRVYEDYQNFKDTPWVVRVNETLGALRMDEKKVVRAICNVP